MTLTDATLVTDTSLALSVDFYVDGAFVGTRNVAGIAVGTINTPATTIDLYSGDITQNVPEGTNPGYITVLMRVYFDGALQKDAAHTYVTSQSLDTSTLGLSVLFSALSNN